MTKKTLVLFAFIAAAAAIVPAAFVVREAGGPDAWRGVVPRGTTDSLYYYGRLHEVVDGHPFVGNPYAYEYRESLSPAFFVPDLLTALPVALGIPFDAAMLANVFLSSLAFLLLAFSLLRRLSVPPAWAVLWSVIAYMASYSFMLRPTVMQVVYPVFLFFLIALAAFLRTPDRRRALWLAAASALAFYTYTYLAYVVFITLGFVFLWYLITRRFSEVRALLLSGLTSVLLLIPFGIYTFVQMRDPNYLETFARIGLVYTRIPAIEAYYYGRWVAVAMAVFALVWLVCRNKEPLERPESGARNLFWIASGAGLLVALVLNVFTGVELALAVHIGRISLPWVPLALGAGLYKWYGARTFGLNKKVLALAGVLLLVLAAGTARSVDRGFDFFGFNARGQTVAEAQAYAAPLAWLRENAREESVVWSDDAIAQYLPILTRHYPLFAPQTVLHNMSDQEVEERYLLSRSLAAFTVDDLKREFGLYVGAGAFKSQPLAENQRAALCNFLSRITGPRECPAYTDAITLRGETYFAALKERFDSVKKDHVKLLARYRVAYLIYDRDRDSWEDLPVERAVYDDGRFAILPLPL